MTFTDIQHRATVKVVDQLGDFMRALVFTVSPFVLLFFDEGQQDDKASSGNGVIAQLDAQPSHPLDPSRHKPEGTFWSGKMDMSIIVASNPSAFDNFKSSTVSHRASRK